MLACSGVESRRRGPRLLRAACGTLSASGHACDLRVSYARQEKGVTLNSSATGALRSEVPAPAHPTRSPFSTPLNLITTHLIVEHNPRSPPVMPASTLRRAHMSLASLPEAQRAVGERPHGEPNRRISGSASKKRVWHPSPCPPDRFGRPRSDRSSIECAQGCRFHAPRLDVAHVEGAPWDPPNAVLSAMHFPIELCFVRPGPYRARQWSPPVVGRASPPAPRCASLRWPRFNLNN